MSQGLDEASMKEMASLKDIGYTEDDEDLFGDNHSDGSLFGDGEDSGSLFGDADDEFMSVDALETVEVAEPKAAAPRLSLPTMLLPTPAAKPVSRGLTLPPTGSDPHGALSRSHVGHTSDQKVVSNPNPSGNEPSALPHPNTGVQQPEKAVEVAGQAGYEQTIDTFAPNSHIHGDQAGHGSVEVASPSSLDPASDTDMSDLIISDLERQLEYDLLQECLMSDQENMPMPPNAADQQQPGPLEASRPDKVSHRPSDSGADNAPLRLPRQVDLDDKGIEFLTRYVSLKRHDSCKTHFDKLELSKHRGAALTKDLRDYLSRAPEARPLLQKGTAGLDPKKRRADYLRLAVWILTNEGWGEKWFGRSSPYSEARRLLWPSQSTIIALRFVSLVYKYIDQAKFGHSRPPLSEKKRLHRARSANTPTPSVCGFESSQVMVIDLTGDDDGDTAGQAFQIPTPITSAAPSRPTSSHSRDEQQQLSLPDNLDQLATFNCIEFVPNSGNQSAGLDINQTAPAIITQATTQTIDVTTSSNFVSSPQPQPSIPSAADLEAAFLQKPDPFIQDAQESVDTMAPPFNVTLASAGGPLLNPVNVSEQFTNIDQLAEHIVSIKRRKNQPAERQDKVDYRFFFVDKLDGLELCSPMMFNMAADMLRGDVVANIRLAFAKAGDVGLIYIYTPTGYCQIRDLNDWKAAVHEVWLKNGDGTAVNVAIHV